MGTPEYFQECACVFDCQDCSRSGHEWHVHSGDECALHPEAEVS